MPEATAGALPNKEWTHAICQDDSGYGVEKTSRHPVAFAATSRPPVARMAASSTNRAPNTSPQPWQARWPDVIEFDRSVRDWTVLSSGSISLFPAANVPT